jgi:uncharacterized membrane protein SpoIIM required for sporulation
MLINRIGDYQATKNQSAVTPSVVIPTGFIILPAFFIAAAAQWQLYQAAYEQARRAAAVPRHHRRFFTVWN